MGVQVLRASSCVPAARRPQVVRASVVPNGLSRRHRYRGNPCGPSLMALSPLDAFFDLSPSQLLETEEFMGLERARPMAVDFVEVRARSELFCPFCSCFRTVRYLVHLRNELKCRGDCLERFFVRFSVVTS